jgi:DNA-binding CsgD family transcriptional regulator
MDATLAQVAWARGRWSEAAEVAEQALADRRGGARAEIGARCALGTTALGRGDFDAARIELERAYQMGFRLAEPEHFLPALWGLAETALLAGEPLRAAELCDEARSVCERIGERALLIPFVLTGTRARLAANRPDEAERWLVAVDAQLGDAALPAATIALRHATGLVRLAAGSTGLARDALEAAVAGWDRIGRAWEASWARLDLAACLLRANRTADATSLLSDVSSAAVRLGSQPLEARADELRRVARGRGGLDEPWAPLTAREFEVARLIAAGLTNGAIATELEIAPKTASAHVEHILAKLGATRRAEIASWATTVDGRRPGGQRLAGGHPASAPRQAESAGAARR